MQQNFSVNLWEGKPPYSAIDDDFIPALDCYLRESEKPAGAVLVFPGGGYNGRSLHEGKDVAEQFRRTGLQAFVCQYRVKPHHHPEQLSDAARAIRHIRHYSEVWNVNPEKIAVCGFSAGGHLAATLATRFTDESLVLGDGFDTISARPDALILGYPVISSDRKFGHSGSFNSLLGEGAPQKLRKHLSAERNVSEKTPPAFVWHTCSDTGVLPENSLAFTAALRNYGILFDLHIFHRGAHGLGLGKENRHVTNWHPLCVSWLTDLGWYET